MNSHDILQESRRQLREAHKRIQDLPEPRKTYALEFLRERKRQPGARQERILNLKARRELACVEHILGWAKLILWTMMLGANTFIMMTTTKGIIFTLAAFGAASTLSLVHFQMNNMPRPARWSRARKG